MYDLNKHGCVPRGSEDASDANNCPSYLQVRANGGDNFRHRYVIRGGTALSVSSTLALSVALS
jgi:hypothetical protein